MNLKEELQIIVRSLEDHADLIRIEIEIAERNVWYNSPTGANSTVALRNALYETEALMAKVQEALDEQSNL